MIKYIILLLGIALISCNPSENNKQSTDNTSANFDWLLGEWKRTNEVEGKETFDIWKKVNENEYAGIGITIQNNDTIFHEEMSFYKSEDQWDLSVKSPDEAEATLFKGVSHNEREFIIENNEIEFPNQIKYWTKDGKLMASVSNSDMEIKFEFEKINK